MSKLGKIFISIILIIMMMLAISNAALNIDRYLSNKKESQRIEAESLKYANIEKGKFIARNAAMIYISKNHKNWDGKDTISIELMDLLQIEDSISRLVKY